MRLLLALLTVSAIACVTGPQRNPRCIYVGDTVGVLVQVGPDGRVVQCAWRIASETTCGLTEHWSRPKAHCVVGEPPR